MLTFTLLWAAIAGVLYVWNDNTQLPRIKSKVNRRFLTVVLLPWAYVAVIFLSVLSILEAIIKTVKAEMSDLKYLFTSVSPRDCWNGSKQ